MKNLLSVFNLKIMPLALAVIMLFNLSAGTFAQALPSAREEKKLDTYFQYNAPAQKDFMADMWQNIKNHNDALNRARDIKSLFQAAKDDKQAPEALPKPMTKAAFSAEYKKKVDSEYRKASLNLEAEKLKLEAALGIADIKEDAPAEERAEKHAMLNKWVEDSQKSLRTWRYNVNAALDKEYTKYTNNFNKELSKAVAQSEAEMEALIQQIANEIIALYKKYPSSEEIKTILMEVAPAIMMLRSDSKDFFTAQDKQLIKNLYINDIRSNDGCEIEVKRYESVGTGYASTYGYVPPATRAIRGQKSEAKCKRLLNSVIGMGFLGSDEKDADLVREFMKKNMETNISVPSLLFGASALLNMGSVGGYDSLKYFINDAVSKEKASDMGFPSLSDLPKLIAYNRLYLGEVSKYYQYPLANGVEGNAWEDLAYLLAEHNTKESREILWKAVECYVVPEGTTWGDRLTCAGIKPFLLGAVLSGKINLEGYKSPRYATESKYNLIAGGRSMTLTDEQIAYNRRNNDWRQSMFEEYMQNTGLTKGGTLAAWLFNSDMGDVNVETKHALDTKLYNYYKKNIKTSAKITINAYPKGGSVYNDKKSLRKTVQVWTGIAIAADIALVVWALWDIGRLAYKGYRLVSSVHKAAKMARAGASIAERTALLTKMGTARTLVKFRRGSRGLKFAASSVAPNFGVKSPVISVDSYITGLPKAVTTPAALTAASKAAVITPVVLADINATTTLGKATAPMKRSYQKIYYDITGKDAFAAKPFKGLDQNASILTNATLHSKKGEALAYTEMGLNAEGNLVVDGVVQKVWKAALEEKEFGTFVSALRKQGFEKTVELKATVQGDKQFFSSALGWVKNKFGNKESQFAIKIDVLDNLGRPMNATLKFDSSYGMSKSLAEANKIVFQGGKFWHEGAPLTLNLGVPKSEVIYMAKNGVNFGNMPSLAINYTKSKIGPLYLNMAMSFSAASSGLYFPLTNDPFKSKTEGTLHVPMITVILPYAFSFLSPFAAGVVSKFGAARTQKWAMMMAAGGLGVAVGAGYHSKVHTDDPALWPLYVASGVTGLASALGRSSLSVLAKELEVGNSMLKGMAFKNIGGLAMLIPPAVGSMVNAEVDFSIAFPVLAATAVGTVGWMQWSKYANNINKISGFKYNLNTVGQTYKIMGNASVMPYLVAFTLYSGYEGQVLFQTGPGLIKDKIGLSKIKIDKENDSPEVQMSKTKTKNILAFGAGALLAIAPAATRWFAPKSINSYSPYILKSATASALGGALLYTQEDGLDWRGTVGLGLLGYGTANMYMFLQKSMLNRLKANYTANPAAFSKYTYLKDGIMVPKTLKQLETDALTAYTAANLGIAIGPQLTSLYANTLKDENGKPIDRTEANRRSLWIPGLMIVGATGILTKTGVISLPKLRLPAGVARGLFEPIGLTYGAYTAGKIANGDFNSLPASQSTFAAPIVPAPLFIKGNLLNNSLLSPIAAPKPAALEGRQETKAVSEDAQPIEDKGAQD